MFRLPRRQKFWSEIRGGALVTLLVAVGTTFASMGFLNDVTSIDKQPFSSAFYRSLASGLMAVAVLLAVARHWAWALVAVALLVGSSVFLAGPALEPPFVGFVDISAATRLQVDSALAVLTVITGYNAFIVFITREGKRQVAASTELALARQMHQSLVPRIDRTIGHTSFHGVSEASGPVGGDIVDVVDLPDRQWLAYVADVSGHGVSSGLIMGMVKSAVRMGVDETVTLTSLARRLNALLCSQLTPATYVTFAALLGRADGRVEMLGAGHPPLLRVSSSRTNVEEVSTDNIPLGIMPDWTFTAASIEFTDGDLLVLVTDGLFEVFDKADRDLGFAAIKQVVAMSRAAESGAVAERLFARAREFGPQLDDQSLLLVRHQPG